MKRLAAFFLVALLLLPGLAQAKIFLVDTDDTLRVVTASGVSTIHMYAAWADLTTTALTPGASDAQVTTATTTVLVAAPAASTQRQIKGLSIRNSHGSSSNLITVQFFDGATATELIAYTLLAGETLQWGEDENFRVIDASGQVKGLVALATGTNSVGQVTANAGTNLNTSSLLTTTAHDAAFGTAGTADSQVRTVQGIASMTPLQVQSNSANLATAALQDGIIKDGTGDTTQANVSNGNVHTNIARMNDVAVSMGVGASGTGTQRVASLIHDGTDTAQVTATSGGSLQVECSAGCSGGTQYNQGTAGTSTDALTMAGAIRKSTPGLDAGVADGDRTTLQVDDNGSLRVVNINPNLAADNSTLSTAKVPVLPGTVSTSAPTWTNGNQSALSLQTDGSVRAAVTNSVTVTASNLDVQIGGSDTLVTNPGTASNWGVYVEDAAETAGANLQMAGSVRRDTAASSAGSTGDNATINTDANGKLWTNADITALAGNAVSTGVGASGTGTQRVASLIHDGTDTAQVTATAGGSLQVECTSGCGGSGGTSIADDAAFTPGTTSVTPAGAMFDDVTPDSVNEGDAGVVRMSANRNLYTTLRDAAGNERGANVNASNELQVAFTPNSAVNVAQMNGVAPSMGAGNTGTGVQRVIEATDSQLSAGVGATGDAAATAGSTGSMNAKQRLMTSQLDSIKTAVETIDNIVSGSGANISQYNGATAQIATNSLNTAGAGLPAAAMVGQCDDVSPTALTENQFGHARINCTTHQQIVEVGTALPAGSNVIGALTANQSVNVAQINGVTPLMGAGNTGTGSPRVTISTDQAALNGLGIYVEDAGETAGGNLAMAGTVRRDTAASSAGTTGDNATLNTDATGLLWTRTIDPCSSGAKTFLPISITSGTTTEITPSLAGASTNYYVCSLVLVTAAANNVALVDDDSDGCGSVTSGMAGGTSAASGFNLAANSGLTFGNGMGAVFKTNGTNRVICLVTSATTQLSGTMTVVAAP